MSALLQTANIAKWEYYFIYFSRAFIILSAGVALYLAKDVSVKKTIFALIIWMFIYAAAALISRVSIKYGLLKYPVLLSDVISVYIIYLLTGALESPFQFLFILVIFTSTFYYGVSSGLFTTLLSSTVILTTNFFLGTQYSSAALFGHSILLTINGLFFAIFAKLKDVTINFKIKIHEMNAQQENIKRKITFLKNLGSSMNNGKNYESIREIFLEALMDIPEAEEVLLRVVSGNELHAKSYIGELSEKISNCTVKIYEGWSGQVFTQRRSIISNDTQKEYSSLGKLYPSKDQDFIDILKNIKAFIAVPIFCCKEVKGVVIVINKSKKHIFSQDHLELVEALAHALGMFIEKEELSQRLNNNLFETVHVLSRAVDAKDKYTHDHSINVAHFSVIIGNELGLSEWEIEKLYFAGLLHDVGKIGIHDNIINKVDKLDLFEWQTMKLHSKIGGEMLSDMETFKEIVDVVVHHHERVDGKGYPDGLPGDKLTLATKILIVADAFDAMISNRSYRKALDINTAKDELRLNSGKQFDPEVTSVFLKWLDRQKEIKRIKHLNDIKSFSHKIPHKKS